MTDFTFYRRIDCAILKRLKKVRKANLAARTLLRNAVMAHCEKNLFLSLKKYDSRRKKKLQHFFFIARGAYLHLFRLLSFTMQFTVMKISVLPGTPLYYSVKMPL